MLKLKGVMMSGLMTMGFWSCAVLMIKVTAIFW